MIRIYKSKEVPNVSVYKKKRWTGPNGTKMTLAERDLIKAINYYGDPTKFDNNRKITKEKAIKYEAYSHPEIKELLKSVFNSKCAYCESFVAHIEPGDIEHFRPKAEVLTLDGEELIPGYYWLGANWNNLLLSCTHCNRPNKQLINGEGELVTMGKANKFPLSDESKRLRSHNDAITSEDAYVLIINPCEEDPEEHLSFEENGQIIPKDSKGEKSIEVYGLYRADLVQRRSRINRQLDNTLWLVVEEIKDMEEKAINNIPIELSLKKLRRHIVMIKEAFGKEAEYLAVKRQKLKRFIWDNPDVNRKLIDYGINLNDLITSAEIRYF